MTVFGPENLHGHEEADANVGEGLVNPTDGRLELWTVKSQTSLMTMTCVKKFLCRCSHRFQGRIIHRQPRRVRIEAERGQVFQMDGEAFRLEKGGTIEIHCTGQSQVLIPKAAPDSAAPGDAAGIWSWIQKHSFWQQLTIYQPERA